MRVKKTHIIDSVVRAAAKKRVQPANHQNKVELKGIPDTDIVEFMIDVYKRQVLDKPSLIEIKVPKDVLKKNMPFLMTTGEVHI